VGDIGRETSRQKDREEQIDTLTPVMVHIYANASIPDKSQAY